VTLKVDSYSFAKGPFRLGEWVVDPRANRVSQGTTTVQLEQRVMSVLLCLAENAGEVVTRQRLVDSVWDEGFVADNTVTHAIAELRKAFRDCARDPLFIETIHRRGYRLIAPVILDAPQADGYNLEPVRFLAIFRETEYPLWQGEYLIGRDPECAITIPSMKVSRHHARITVEGPRTLLDDLESKNGTFLNGIRIECSTAINGGDLIGIGRITETIRFVASLSRRTTEPEFDA
jgi:DNA-binding winged helix-turn-helix (wHTH) protein